MSLPAKVGVALPLVSILEDGNISQFPQAKVYAQGATTPIATIDLVHKVDGRYEADWTPASTGVFLAHFITYSDGAHTVENITYSREGEQIVVFSTNIDDLATAIVRLLGLSHENAFIDLTEFDPNGQLLSARLRIFDSKANAAAATDGGSETTGLIATYTMTAVYEGVGRLKSYRYIKEP